MTFKSSRKHYPPCLRRARSTRPEEASILVQGRVRRNLSAPPVERARPFFPFSFYAEAKVPKKKITRVTAETHQVLIIRKTKNSVRAWCESCGAQAQMLSLEQAAAISGLSLRGICRAVDAGSIHFTETGGGSLLICLDSLLKLRKEGER